MKSYKITEEQIKEMKSWGNTRDAKKVEQWFPEVFETKLEVGKWYKHKEFKDILICPERISDKGILYGFGFNQKGKWVSDENYLDGSCLCNEVAAKYLIPATEEEVKESLVREANKRYFDVGSKWIKPYSSMEAIANGDFGYSYSFYNNDLTGFQFDGKSIFHNGKWAEIIEEEIKVVEKEEPTPRYTVTFETLGAVTVTLEGNNLDNLMAIAKENNLR